MKPHYLLVFDFDGTAAQTFEPSPNGIGVNEAYAKSIEAIFGEKGLTAYQQIGGLQNRAPSELVNLLLSHDSTEELIDNASVFFVENHRELAGCAPSYQGGILEWDSTNPEKTITEMVVRQKLLYLAGEIGTRFPDGQVWPKPCEGFQEIWQIIRLINLDEKCRLTTAVVSSGHETFIRRVFAEVLKLQPPDILVTEDDIRWREYPTEMTRRVKPGQLQFALAHKEWLDIQRSPFDNGESLVNVARGSRARMIYFGDDPSKDGQMAKVASVVFGLFKDGQSYTVNGNEQFSFGDWRDIGERLSNNQEGLMEGRPLAEIFLRQPNTIESCIPYQLESGGLRARERV